MSRTSIALYVVTILAGVGASILLAGVIRARRVRMEAVETRLDKLGGLDQKIFDDQLVVDQLATKVLSSRKEWGRVWPNAGNVGIIDTDQGIIQLGIGNNAGLGLAARDGGALPVIHVFGVDGGDNRYLGEFQATAVDAQTTTAKLERLPFAGESDKWLANGYRVREAIPEAYNALIGELVTSKKVATQKLQEQQQRVVRAQNQLSDSQAALQLRLNELNGDPQVDETEDPARAKGLTQLLADKSAERDELRASVDRLRRTYRDKSEELKGRLQRLRDLATRLPGGGNDSASFEILANPTAISR